MSNEYRYRSYSGNYGEKERFDTTAEMISKLTAVDLTKDGKLNSGGAPIFSDTKLAYVDGADYHTLILGSTGSMKTRTIILPTVFTLALTGENMMIADPKGEIYATCSGYLAAKGYEVNVINLRDIKRSGSWNPLHDAYRVFASGQKTAGLALGNNFIHSLCVVQKDDSDPFWSSSAEIFLDACLELVFRGAKDESEANMASLLTIFDIVTEENANYAEDKTKGKFFEFIESLPESSLLRVRFMRFLTNARVTLGGIMANASAATAPFSQSKDLLAMSSHTNVDVHAIANPDKKVVYFLIVPDETTTLHFFAASFIKQLYDCGIEESYKLPKGRLPRRLNFVLDEFANIPKISDMPSMITAARSRNMRFFLVVQSDSQLRSIYGEQAATIKTNCLNWMYLNSKETDLIKEVQTMIGTDSATGKPLITFHELASLRKEEGDNTGGADCLVLLSRANPYMSFLPDISRYKQFDGFGVADLPKIDEQYSSFTVAKRCFNITHEEFEERFLKNDVEPKVQPRTITPEEAIGTPTDFEAVIDELRGVLANQRK